MQHFVLIPGFLGFNQLGKLSYFVGVSDALSNAAADEGALKHCGFYQIETLPTSSIAERAQTVTDFVRALPPGDVHLVGHSTGGLDARLAAQLLAEHGRTPNSVVCVATPHHGTPLAEFSASAMGQPTLRLVSALAYRVMDRGKIPLQIAVRALEFLHEVSGLVGYRSRFFDQLFDQLLRDLPDEHREELAQLFLAISKDASLVFQLTREGLDVLNAAARIPEGVKHGSVVTMVSPPSRTEILHHLYGPYEFASFLVFRIVYAVTRRGRKLEFPENYRLAFDHAFGRVPDSTDSDGIVPTLSQCWGQPISVTWADHLDVVGHFGGERSADTLPSRSDFSEADFEKMWRKVWAFCMQKGPPHT